MEIIKVPKILTVGDGNFSFSKSLLLLHKQGDEIKTNKINGLKLFFDNENTDFCLGKSIIYNQFLLM